MSDFFVGLGLEAQGRQFVEGEFLDTVIEHPELPHRDRHARPAGWRHDARAVRASSGRTLSLARRWPWPDELGLRNVAFEVDDLQAVVDAVTADGYALVGGIGEYEGMWRMAYGNAGPEGIIVSLAERLG